MSLVGEVFMVDVIIPVYNAYNYIGETLDSIFKQTYRNNIKVYIVDDCSEEKNLDILKEYNDKLDITILELEKNRGPGFCRQYGMKHSNSKYILFIDSDDYFLDNDGIEKMVLSMEENNYDTLSAIFTEDCYGEKNSYYVGYDTVHAKIYRRKFLEEKNICFPFYYNSEDVSFNNLVILSTDNIGKIDSNIYLYRRRKKSLTDYSNYDDDKHISFYCKNLLFVIQWAENNKIDKKRLSMLLRNSYCYFMWYFNNEVSMDNKSIHHIFDLFPYYDKYQSYYDDTVGNVWLKYWVNVIDTSYSKDEFLKFIDFCKSSS